MDFVKELGLTVLAGAFAMLGIEVIWHFFLNKRPFTALAHKLSAEAKGVSGADDEATKSARRTGKDEKDQTFTVVVFVLIAFAAGIFLEDLSLKYLDRRPLLCQDDSGLVSWELQCRCVGVADEN